MRVAFLGTGEIAIPAFRRLIAEGLKPVVLVTQPDKPVGRGLEVTEPLRREGQELSALYVSGLGQAPSYYRPIHAGLASTAHHRLTDRPRY